MFALLFSISFFSLAVSTAHEPIVEIGNAIATGNTLTEFSSDVLVAHDEGESIDLCRTLILRHHVIIRVTLADAALQEELSGESDSVLSNFDRKLEQAQRAIERLLSCSPTNGLAWLRFGLSEGYAFGYGKRAVNAALLSQTYAPHEKRVVEARLENLPDFDLSTEPFEILRNIRRLDEVAASQ